MNPDVIVVKAPDEVELRSDVAAEGPSGVRARNIDLARSAAAVNVPVLGTNRQAFGSTHNSGGTARQIADGQSPLAIALARQSPPDCG